MTEKYVSFGYIVELPPSSNVKQPIQTQNIQDKANIEKFVGFTDNHVVEDAFQDMVQETPEENPNTLVALDAANIGWAYGNASFSIKGVLIAIDFFHKVGCTVRAFLPASFIKSKPNNGEKGNSLMITDDIDALLNLVSLSQLTIVPSGDSDDAYFITFARENNGFVVSNDHFRDHIRSIKCKSIARSLEVWLEDNRCGYTFVGDKFFINPSSRLSFVYNNRLIYTQALNKKTLPNDDQSSILQSQSRISHEIVVTKGVDVGHTSLGSLLEPLLTLTQSIDKLHTLSRKKELRFALLTRIGLLLEVYVQFTDFCYLI
jgi:hypothetical protein